MPETTLAKRVETLENVVMGPGGLLRQVGELRTEVRDFRSEFLQFRDWTKVEFSAVRDEMKSEFAQVRKEMATASEMRTLYEDLVERIARLGEGPRRRPSR